MKRLTYIYLAAPLTVALNAVPCMVDGMWRVLVASALGLVLWAVIWLRVYHTRKLRPEYAVLAIIPALCNHVLHGAGPEYIQTFSSPGWQNFNFFLWVAAALVMIRSLLPTKQEYSGPISGDAVLIFMSLITIAYTFNCWMTTHINL